MAVYMLGLGLGLELGLFSALLDMFRTRSPMFDRLQRPNKADTVGCAGIADPYHALTRWWTPWPGSESIINTRSS